MGEALLTALSMENHHLSTFLSMDSSGGGVGVGGTAPLPSAHFPHLDDSDGELMIHPPRQHISSAFPRPPDINLPLTADPSPPPPPYWGGGGAAAIADDILDVGLSPHPSYDTIGAALNLPRPTSCGVVATRKFVKRGDGIWGAWFFFTIYFKPVLSDKSKAKIARDASGVSGFEKSDLKLDVFMVQHDMENMYMWVFKERPENALGKMQLRSFMNGHSQLGEPQFPFSVDKGFVRSHRMQRKQYRGLSNPQCIHGIEVRKSPNLAMVSELDRKKWMELTGIEPNFSIPPESSDFGSWRNLPNMEFEFPSLKSSNSHPQQRKLLNDSGLNLLTQPLNHSGSAGDGLDLSQLCGKRRKDLFPHAMDEDCCLPVSSYSERIHDIEMQPVVEQPSWMNEFSGVMRHSYGPVTATKLIYEDNEGYLIMVSLPFSDQQRVKVSWRNCLTHGVVKISSVSTARMPYIKRHDRTFKLTDPSPEHCPPGEFVREIPLATRIPEDAKLEAYCDKTGTVLEIMVPKHRAEPEEHEVRVCMRPPYLAASDLLLC